ncbi:hypothetical protein F4780DRAFT_767543 [Xylariomycetidae sp. FL0641]|nr:hypothetical protein F4780DRAFT_767543 [Xylariomycetidae sp. FL0641]
MWNCPIRPPLSLVFVVITTQIMASRPQERNCKRDSPLAFMEKLSSAVSLYRPPNLGLAAPPTTTDPQLILVLGWMDARDAHLARYINQYRTLFPSSCILLVKSRFADLVLPSAAFRDTAPAVGPIRAALQEPAEQAPGSRGPSAPRLLVHALSGGGSCSLYQLYHHFSLPQPGGIRSSSRLPRHVTIFDSSPGLWSYRFNVDLLTASLKPGWHRLLLALPLAHLVAAVFWVLIRVCGLPDNQETYAAAHRDARRNDERARAYIYSGSDTLCPADCVEADAAEAKRMGFDVRLERFEGSGHVAHVRADAERYWRVVKETWDAAVEA